jgi:hypothetical protein
MFTRNIFVKYNPRVEGSVGWEILVHVIQSMYSIFLVSLASHQPIRMDA